ncbi:hypothetical protein RhiirA5_496455 [Rhizophagus irregularis]|uniref:Uncharacterized protein n=1 Tax=Rhizophagus irregularis TaxID=588596 RepID=A0A2N0Q200_9GLOM|nr:hypothetical protein RhiirA5_496455 [Rhizophagus irregularis]
MPEHMRRFCFNQITDSESNIDVQSGYNIIFFYNALESGEFLGHENDWVTVYNQEIIAYGKLYSDDELNHIFKKMPSAIQLPVNQKRLPRSKKRKMVTTNHVNNASDYKVRASVRRPEEPGLVALINYTLYDKTLRGDEGWKKNPITSSGYGEGANEIYATRMFEVRLGDKHDWTKWVQAKISVWEQDPGDEVEHALIGNDITDQLAYAHEPKRPIKFLDSTDEEKLTQFLNNSLTKIVVLFINFYPFQTANRLCKS